MASRGTSIRLNERNQFVTSISIHRIGHPADKWEGIALVDTGASRTVVSPEVAPTLGLRQISAVKFEGIGTATGESMPVYAAVINLMVPGPVQPGWASRVLDIAARNKPFPRFGVLLGEDFLKHLHMDIDGETLHVLGPASGRPANP